MTVSLILDLLLAVLLVVTIVYAAILNGRLRDVRRGRAEMEATLRRFAEATGSAQAAIAGLKESEEAVARPLKTEVERARALRDELAFLTERGAGLAARLATSPHGASPREPAPRAAAATAETGDAGKAFVRKAPPRPRPPAAGRPTTDAVQPAGRGRAGAGPEARSAAERQLLHALRAAR